jgi:putative transposase
MYRPHGRDTHGRDISRPSPHGRDTSRPSPSRYMAMMVRYGIMAMRHNRRSTRLRNHGYGPGTTLFITICTVYRRPYFGRVENGVMRLSAIGQIVDDVIRSMPAHAAVRLHEHIVMPDHIHVLFTILGDPATRVLQPKGYRSFSNAGAQTCGVIIGSLKAAVTREVRTLGLLAHTERIWHRNYHDRIVRGRDLTPIQRYIRNNPAAWDRKHRK